MNLSYSSSSSEHNYVNFSASTRAFEKYSTLNCSSDYWGNETFCQKCGLCKIGLCHVNDGTCESNSCMHVKLEKPFCNKCIQSLTNYPDCDLKICSLDCSCANFKENLNCINFKEISLNLTFLWLTTLTVIISHRFILNRKLTKKYKNVNFLYNLEFNQTCTLKTNFKEDI